MPSDRVELPSSRKDGVFYSRSRSRSRGMDCFKDDIRGNERNDQKHICKYLLQDPVQDKKLPKNVPDDPRFQDGINKDAEIALRKKVGRNTESFDPESTLVRPSLRVIVGPNKTEVYPVEKKGKLKHDDVVIVPEFFGEEDDWSLYYKLIEEMAELQEKENKGQGKGKKGKKGGPQWISWHEGAHLITKNPEGSKTFQEIQRKIAKYFGIEQKSVGTRFNWYRDSKDWKPFHHDSAAFNRERAAIQNVTVGVSFGSTRELAFLHAKSGERVYFPQTNNMMFSFGRDANIVWKHGINALSDEEQKACGNKGRISIILWGWVPDSMIVEEKGSPPMLDDNTRGFGHNIHSSKGSKDGGKGESKGNACRDYQRTGYCNYGDRCKFSHNG